MPGAKHSFAASPASLALVVLPVQSHRLHSGTTATDCVICYGLADFALRNSRDPLRAFVPPSADAVADAMGFCAPHAAMLAASTDDFLRLLAVLSSAAGKVIAQLLDRSRSEERLTKLLVGAGTACPICYLADHRLPRQLRGVLSSLSLSAGGSMEPLCLTHFQALIAMAPRAVLKHAAECQIASLRAIGIATNTRLAQLYVGGRHHAASPVPNGELDDFLCDDQACPICRKVSMALDDWMASVEDAARLGAHQWIVFPTCDRHISLCAHRCSDETARQIVAYASTLLSGQLEHAVASNEREDRAYDVARDSVWFRRKSPAYLLGQRRKTLLRSPRCPGCERLAVARDRACADMLTLLRRASVRRAFSASNGLCLKHFAHALLVAQGDEMRNFLASTQIAQLSELQRILQRVVEHAANSDAASSPVAQEECRRAIYRFSAFV